MMAELAGTVALLRRSRAGTLATNADGGPYASLVTPATASDRTPLLFLSGLSPHTAHLRADPRCSLLLVGPAAEENPQTAPRVTLTGVAEPTEDAGLKARWLAHHPYASFYADLPDFSIWRLRPEAAHFIGGFARASAIAVDSLRPDPATVAAVEAAAPDIMDHCNGDHADALAALAGSDAPWRMTAVDVDGCVLATSERALRLAWPAPVRDAAGIRAALIAMLAEARETDPGRRTFGTR